MLQEDSSILQEYNDLFYEDLIGLDAIKRQMEEDESVYDFMLSQMQDGETLSEFDQRQVEGFRTDLDAILIQMIADEDVNDSIEKNDEFINLFQRDARIFKLVEAAYSKGFVANFRALAASVLA